MHHRIDQTHQTIVVITQSAESPRASERGRWEAEPKHENNMGI